MIRRLAFTIAIFVSLFGFYAVYAVTMKSIVILPVRPEQTYDESTVTSFDRPRENVRIAETYLPVPKVDPKSLQKTAVRQWNPATSKYMFRADEAWIYTDSVDRIPDSKRGVRFKPFAVAFVSNDKEGVERAYSMVSDEYADIEFADEFDEKKNPGRVVKAFLRGNVEIKGPDGLSIVGQNFSFNEADLKMSTTSRVKFKYEPSETSNQQSFEGHAGRMEINLIPAPGMPGKDRPHIFGIESLRLIATGQKSRVLLKSTFLQGAEIKTAYVMCAGDLTYSVDTKTAVASKDVIAWTGSKKDNDKLECDQLQLKLRSKAKVETAEHVAQPSRPQESPPDEYQHLETNLEFASFEATGKVVHLLRTAADVKTMQAKMSKLTYDTTSQRLMMTAEGSRRDVEVIQFQPQNQAELRVPEISVELTEQNELSSIICRGAGKFSYLDKIKKKRVLGASWQQKLCFTPAAVGNEDLIAFEGQAIFGHLEQEIGLEAESIKVWIASMNFKMASAKQSTGGATELKDIDPKRMLALGDVKFDSPRMKVDKTNQLEIVFAPDAPGVSQANIQNRRQNLKPASFAEPSNAIAMSRHIPLSAPRATSNREQPAGFASIPAETKSDWGSEFDIQKGNDPSDSQKPESFLSDEPVVLTASRIRVEMKKRPGKTEADWTKIQTVGRVKLVQNRPLGQKPLTLEGDQVDVEQEAKDCEIVKILGRPALIKEQRFEIEGNEIYLNRGENRALVEGVGRLKLEIPKDIALPKQMGPVSRDLNIRWAERMEFDGLDAVFIGSVDAKLGHGSMNCEKMTVTLVERLSFQQTSLVVAPAIESINCRENVRFSNSTYDGKRLIDILKGKVGGKISWNQTTGKVFAQGPGMIEAWQRQATGAGSFSPQDAAQANRPSAVEITDWDYSRVTFEGMLNGEMSGDLANESSHRTATINDRVELVRGPVKGPNQKIDPDHLPSKAGTIRCDKLTFGNHPKMSRNSKPQVQLVGEGNAEIEGQVDGRIFTASASKISFDGSKGNYRLWGQARLTGVGTGGIAGDEISFNPERSIYNVSRATEGQGTMVR